MANETLLDFERKTKLGSTSASSLLGVAYQTYASYRNERRDLPLYHAYQIEIILMLPKRALQTLIEARVHGSN